MFKLLYNCTHFMLKILQARLQQYVNWGLPDVQARFRKGRGTRDQIANIHWIIEKAREFQKKHLFPFHWLRKSLCVDHNKHSVQQFCRSVTSDSLGPPMDCSTPGFPVHPQLLEHTQTHVHWVGDAIQSSHPLSSPSPAFSLSQHQGLFQWVSSSHPVAKVLEFQLQDQSFQWIFRTDFL